MHASVLTPETVNLLNVKPEGIYCDATGGGGGHSAAILKKLGSRGQLIIADRDPAAVDPLKSRFAGDPQCRIVHGKFSGLFEKIGKGRGLKLDGLVADLGLSSIQLDDTERGFSFNSPVPLDMRMDPSEEPGLVDKLSDSSEKEIADILFQYGEERHSRKMARALCEALRRRELKTTADLGELAQKVLGRFYTKMKIHPATRIFQALRIWVNDELTELSTLLRQLPLLMAPQGRVVIISFHSLEDRCVKQGFKSLANEGWKVLTKKPLIPGQREREENPRSRSAKLRAIERLKNGSTSSPCPGGHPEPVEG